MIEFRKISHGSSVTTLGTCVRAIDLLACGWLETKGHSRLVMRYYSLWYSATLKKLPVTLQSSVCWQWRQAQDNSQCRRLATSIFDYKQLLAKLCYCYLHYLRNQLSEPGKYNPISSCCLLVCTCKTYAPPPVAPHLADKRSLPLQKRIRSILW